VVLLKTEMTQIIGRYRTWSTPAHSQPDEVFQQFNDGIQGVVGRLRSDYVTAIRTDAAAAAGQACRLLVSTSVDSAVGNFSISVSLM
jgi:hypothetical protein